MRPIEVAAAFVAEEEGEEGAVAVLELRLEGYTTRAPFTFRGGRLVGLLKPQVVQKVDRGRTRHINQIDISHVPDRLALLAEEVRLLGTDGLHALSSLPVQPKASVAKAGTVEVLLGVLGEGHEDRALRDMCAGDILLADRSGGPASPRRRPPLPPVLLHAIEPLRFLRLEAGPESLFRGGEERQASVHVFLQAGPL